MAKWTPAKADTLEALASEILHNYARGRVLVAVDGRDRAGTALFADDLAGAFHALGSRVVRASIDQFLRPVSERSAGSVDSTEDLYGDSFDYETFRRVLAHPFRSGELQERTRGAEQEQEQEREQEQEQEAEHSEPIPADAILLVDGLFLNRRELAGLWNYSIWLDSAPGLAAHELYEAEARPRAAAVAIIDNTDVEHPRRIFADAC